jgi:hypothetical protein
MANTIQIKMQDVRFRQKLSNYYRDHLISSSKILRSQARLLAENLAFQTQPFEKDQKAKQMGEMAVERDIRKVYRSAGEIGLSDALSYSIKHATRGQEKNKSQNPENMARAFVYLVSKGKYGEAQKLLQRVGVSQQEITQLPIGKMDGGQAHQSARHGGRKRVSKNQLPLRIVSDGQIKTYINKIRRNVGIAKAGWAACSRIIGGTRGIPQWVTRNIGKAGGGSVADSSVDKNRPRVVLQNHVPWIDQCLSTSQLARAVRIQHEKMVKAIDKSLRAEAKAIGF